MTHILRISVFFDHERHNLIVIVDEIPRKLDRIEDRGDIKRMTGCIEGTSTDHVHELLMMVVTGCASIQQRGQVSAGRPLLATGWTSHVHSGENAVRLALMRRAVVVVVVVVVVMLVQIPGGGTPCKY